MTTDNNVNLKAAAEEIARQAAALVQLADNHGSPAAQLACKTAIQKQINLAHRAIQSNIEAESDAIQTAQSEDAATPRGHRDHGFVTTEIMPPGYGHPQQLLPPGYMRPRY